MQVYKKKPVHVQAAQWQKHGDHEQVKEGPMLVKQFAVDMDTGSAVPLPPRQVGLNPAHGWIDTPENAHEVTPGDYIIKGTHGEFYPCKPNIFEANYELVESQDVEFEEVKSDSRIHGNAGRDVEVAE